MTVEEDAYIIGNLILTAILMPIGIIMLSTFLTGDIDMRRDMALAVYIITALIVIIVVLGTWTERRR